MSPEKKKNQNEIVAESIAQFFFEYWMNKDERVDKTAGLESDSLLEEADPHSTPVI